MRLLVTRNADQLTELSGKAKEKGIEVSALPLLSISSVSFNWPEELESNPPDWIWFTSANGVNHFFEQINKKDKLLSRETKIGAIGAGTVRALLDYSRTADFVPSISRGKVLIEEFLEKYGKPDLKLVYARAEMISFDPAELLKEASINYYPIVCYKTELAEVEQNIVYKLSEHDFILFTAPSAVRAYYEQFSFPTAMPIAIGQTTADKMHKLGWPRMIIMDKPDVMDVLEYI